MKIDSSKPTDPAERLASYLEGVPFPLSENEDVERVANRLARDAEALSLVGPKVTVQVLSSFLTDYLINHLVLMFARRGIEIEIQQGKYGVLAGAILDESNQIHDDPPDLFLILPSHRDLMHCPQLGSSVEEAKKAVNQEVSFWHTLWSRLSVHVVQMSFDTPYLRPLGEIDGFTPGSIIHHARQVNLELAGKKPASVTLVDTELLVQTLGSDRWYDPHVYYLCKQPFSFRALPFLADALSAAATGLLGMGRKVIVLDLDNTLWGGTIGDEGLENIQLGPETPEGEAYFAFQKYLMLLRQRGIILAVCSKNQEETARLPFQSHPSMVIKESDIACFIANFNDKPKNIQLIAESLNVSLEALVFVDDNPVERALVRRELPQVLTVEMPENPALFASVVENCRAFPLSCLTETDLQRADSYTSRAVTAEAMVKSTDIEGFLASMKAKVIFERPGPGTRDRILQLLAKTNQFKLNKKTFTYSELVNREKDFIVLRLVDRLQDYGIVSVAILSSDLDTENAIFVENWVMSCRVFARRLEFVMLEQILDCAEKLHAEAIKLIYKKNERNGLIGDLLPELGFDPKVKDDLWYLRIVREKNVVVVNLNYPPHHMDVISLS